MAQVDSKPNREKLSRLDGNVFALEAFEPKNVFG